MRRRLFFVLGAVGLLLALVVVAVVLFQDPDRYREQVASLLSDAAGYPVTLDGPLALSWRPSPTLTATRVGVEAPSARVVLDTVQVRLEPGALLARQFRAREVRVEGVVIDLGAATPSDAPVVIPDPANIPVDHFVVNDLRVRRGEETVFQLRHADLRAPDSPRGAKVELALAVPGGELTGRVRLKVPAGRVELDEMVLDTPLGRIEGRLSLATGAPRLRVNGELTADAVVVQGRRTQGVQRIFPDHPVDLTPLSFLDASVRLRIGRLSLAGVRLSDVTIPLTVDGGRLNSSTTARFAGGAVDASVDIVASNNSGDNPGDNKWSLVLDLKQADAGDALGMLGVTNAEKGGRLDAQVELTASGADTRTLLSSLTGHANADATQMHLRAGAAALAGSDVLASVGRMLSGGDSNRVRVECAVARFAVRDGVASSNDRIAVQTGTMNVLGGGQISLLKERLDLVFRPWPREGLGLSATTVVGSVAVTGPLSNPKVGLTGDSALRGGASAGAALLTGGLSLIAQGLMERARGDAPCQDAASGRRAARPAASSATLSGTLDRAADGASKAAESVGGAVQGIGRSLKGLFGGSGGGTGATSGGSDQ